jgi:hypothetical protein
MECEEVLATLEGKAADQAKAMRRRQKKERVFWVVVSVVDLVLGCLLGAGISQVYGEFWGQLFVVVVGGVGMSTLLLLGVMAWLRS